VTDLPPEIGANEVRFPGNLGKKSIRPPEH